MRRRDGETRVEYKGDWEEESSVGHASGVIRGEGSGHSDNDEATVGNRNMAQRDIILENGNGSVRKGLSAQKID